MPALLKLRPGSSDSEEAVRLVENMCARLAVRTVGERT
jgi:hypothetical protein